MRKCKSFWSRQAIESMRFLWILSVTYGSFQDDITNSSNSAFTIDAIKLATKIVPCTTQNCLFLVRFITFL